MLPKKHPQKTYGARILDKIKKPFKQKFGRSSLGAITSPPIGEPRTTPRSSIAQTGPADITKAPEQHVIVAQVIWKGAKFCLAALKESSDAFGPLKSVVGGISFFLENHEKYEANKETLERLVSRIVRLVEFSKNSSGQLTESGKNRLQRLEKTFRELDEDLESLENGKTITKYIMATDESGKLSGIAESIHVAIIEYQLSQQQETYEHVLSLMKEADMNILEKLPRAKTAGYESETNTGCLLGTRTDILNTLEAWATDYDVQRVYWLNGHAGSGKSTIAHTFCQRLDANGQLGASFFCSRESLERSDLKLIFPTLAFQLACRYTNFCGELVETLKKRPNLGSESMINQLTELLVKPLIASGLSTTIAIDALDESKDQEPASTILSLLARVIDQLPKVKFFVTGRPESPIRRGVRDLQPHTEIMVLHEVQQSNVDYDISLYLNFKLSKLVENRSDCDLSEPWPSKDQVQILVTKSSKLFIFAATVVRLLSPPPHFDPREQLIELTNSETLTSSVGGSGLDALYTQILEDEFPKRFPKVFLQLRRILGVSILSYHPLSVSSFSGLLQVNARTILGGLHSLLLIPDSDAKTLHIHHKSFSDYLVDRQRCTNDAFYINPAEYHADIAIACLDYMKVHLKKNICSLPRYSINSVMPITQRRACVGETLEYACQFWARHVCESDHDGESLSRLLPALCEFFRERQILWLEVLSLLDDLHRSISSLRQVEDWLLKVTDNDQANAVLPWLEDGLHFVLRFFECIEVSACHLYHSALPLAPTSSLIRKVHVDDLKSEATRLRGNDHWESQRMLRINFPASPFSIAFSQDGNVISVFGRDLKIPTSRTIELFNTVTGQHLHTLGPLHTRAANPVAPKFVVDDTLLLTGCSSTELWDVRTGCLVRSYQGHLDAVTVETDMSLDQHYIASRYDDGFVAVWETHSGQLVHEIKFDDMLDFLAFPTSSDSLFLATQHSIWVWKFDGDIINEFPCTHRINRYTISSDRSLLSATSPFGLSTYIVLFDTRTRNFIWEHLILDPGIVKILSVLPSTQTLWLCRDSFIETLNYTTLKLKSTSVVVEGLSLISAAITRDCRIIGRQDDYGNVYIHPLQSLDADRSSGQLSTYSNNSRILPMLSASWDRGRLITVGMNWGDSEQSCIWNVDHHAKDIILTSERDVPAYKFITSVSPNGKVIAIVKQSPHYFVVQFWDYAQISPTLTSKIKAVTLPTFFLEQLSLKFINDHICVVVYEPPPTDNSVALAWLIKSNDGHFSHLDFTAHIPSGRFPQLERDRSKWLIDNDEKKVVWIPHDMREVCVGNLGIGNTFIMGGKGVFTGMDFSNIRDIKMHGYTDRFTAHENEVATYVQGLLKAPPVNMAEIEHDEDNNIYTIVFPKPDGASEDSHNQLIDS